MENPIQMGDLGVPSFKETPIFGRKKKTFKTLKLHGPKWLSESTKCSQSTRDEPNRIEVLDGTFVEGRGKDARSP